MILGGIYLGAGAGLIVAALLGAKPDEHTLLCFGVFVFASGLRRLLPSRRS